MSHVVWCRLHLRWWPHNLFEEQCQTFCSSLWSHMTILLCISFHFGLKRKIIRLIFSIFIINNNSMSTHHSICFSLCVTFLFNHSLYLFDFLHLNCMEMICIKTGSNARQRVKEKHDEKNITNMKNSTYIKLDSKQYTIDGTHAHTQHTAGQPPHREYWSRTPNEKKNLNFIILHWLSRMYVNYVCRQLCYRAKNSKHLNINGGHCALLRCRHLFPNIILYSN